MERVPNNRIEYLPIEEIKELVEVGIVSWTEAANRLIGDLLGVVLTDRQEPSTLIRTYLNLRSYDVLDASNEVSKYLALCVNFDDDRCKQPRSFCFVDVRTDTTVLLNIHEPVNRLPINTVNTLGKYHRYSSQFEELTREVYLSAVENVNKPPDDEAFTATLSQQPIL
jgi:hypothetical protein